MDNFTEIELKERQKKFSERGRIHEKLAKNPRAKRKPLGLAKRLIVLGTFGTVSAVSIFPYQISQNTYFNALRKIEGEGVAQEREKQEIIGLINLEQALTRNSVKKEVNRLVNIGRNGLAEALKKHPYETVNRIGENWFVKHNKKGGVIKTIDDAIERGREFFPQMVYNFNELGVPKELGFYLFTIEAEFRNQKSKKGAEGVAQIIPSTAKAHGINVNEGCDERRNKVISLLGSARILNGNYRITRNWDLAFDWYNSGLVGKYLERWKLFGSEISEKGYLKFLGTLFEKNRFIPGANESLNYIAKRIKVREILLERHPKIFNTSPSQDYVIVNPLKKRYIHVVKQNENPWNIIEEHLKETYGFSTDSGIGNTINFLGIGSHILPGEKIVINPAKTFGEAASRIGANMELNKHVKNPNEYLPNCKIVSAKT